MLSHNYSYQQCLDNSKKVAWKEDDVFAGKNFDFSKRFLPNRLSGVDNITCLNDNEKRQLNQIMGNAYCHIFAFVEEFIIPMVMQAALKDAYGEEVRLRSLLRFAEEELKHQELFRRIERMVAEGMPAGYRFLPQPNDVAGVVLGKSTWAVLALTCHIELFTLTHYRQSIDPDGELSELYKDVFLFHWKEESQHAILDELEWRREDAKLSPAERDRAVTELIELVAAVDGILQVQAAADADYFFAVCRGPYSPEQSRRVREAVLAAYRWQYIVSGVEEPRFQAVLGSLIDAAQGKRIGEALAPILAGVSH
jgi:hypothetical protein